MRAQVLKWGAQISLRGKNVASFEMGQASFTLGQKCAFWRQPLFRKIPTFIFWECVGWALYDITS